MDQLENPRSQARNGSRVLAGAVLAGGPVVLNGQPSRAPERLSPREEELVREATERGLAEGLEAGREAGFAEGQQAAVSELRTTAQALRAALEQLGDERGRLLGELQRGALDLALAVARKLVHTELDGNVEAVARTVQAAIDHAKEATIVRVRLHPRDRDRLEQLHDGAFPHELAADPSIAPGGCIVETDCGAIDATVDTRWEQVTAAIVQAGEGRGASGEGPAEEESGVA